MVWHSVASYLPLTEGWIHLQLIHQTRHPQRVITHRLTPESLARFPFSPVQKLRDSWLDRLWLRWSKQDRVGRYRPLFRQTPPRLLHAHFGNQSYRILPLAEHLRVPLITTFYGYDCSMLLKRPAWQARFRHLFQRGDLFLVEGPQMGKTLIQAGCPPEKVQLQHLGIPERPFRLRRPRARPRILMAASFREKKGLQVGLQALSLLKAPVEIVIAGDGPLRPQLLQMAESGGLAVRWTGYLEPEALTQAMLDADLFLQPSLTASDGDSEGGAPVTLLEAQATGLPVVATTHADIPEVTRPGESAILVAENNVEQLAEAIQLALASPERWAEMGRAGRDHVRTEFSARRQGERLAAIYDRYLLS